MKKKILILNDRFDLKNSLINLGDRALSDGLYRLLGKNLDYEIVSGGWKNIDYIEKHNKELRSILSKASNDLQNKGGEDIKALLDIMG